MKQKIWLQKTLSVLSAQSGAAPYKRKQKCKQETNQWAGVHIQAGSDRNPEKDGAIPLSAGWARRLHLGPNCDEEHFGTERADTDAWTRRVAVISFCMKSNVKSNNDKHAIKSRLRPICVPILSYLIHMTLKERAPSANSEDLPGVAEASLTHTLLHVIIFSRDPDGTGDAEQCRGKWARRRGRINFFTLH